MKKKKVLRTADEIVERIRQLRNEDFLGVIIADLIKYLPFESCTEFLKKEYVDDVQKNKIQFNFTKLTRKSVLSEMREYMPFAWEKAQGQRGISSSRSYQHFQSWLWLLGDEEYDAIDWCAYNSYGKPILEQISKIYNLEMEGKKN